MQTYSPSLISFFLTIYTCFTLLIALHIFVTFFFDLYFVSKLKKNLYARNELSKTLIRFGTTKLVIDILFLIIILISIVLNKSYNFLSGIDNQDIIVFLVFEIFFGISPLLIGLVLKNISNQLLVSSINLKIGENLHWNKDGTSTIYKIEKIDSVTRNVHLVDYYSNEELIVLPYYIVIQQIKLGIFNYYMFETPTKELLNI
jgi:hypothetical protein